MSEIHPIQRARERYGIQMTITELRQHEKECAAGRGPNVVLQANLPGGTQRMLIKHGETILTAVFDSARRKIVTFLAPDMRMRKTRRKKGQRQ